MSNEKLPAQGKKKADPKQGNGVDLLDALFSDPPAVREAADKELDMVNEANEVAKNLKEDLELFKKKKMEYANLEGSGDRNVKCNEINVVLTRMSIKAEKVTEWNSRSRGEWASSKNLAKYVNMVGDIRSVLSEVAVMPNEMGIDDEHDLKATRGTVARLQDVLNRTGRIKALAEENLIKSSNRSVPELPFYPNPENVAGMGTFVQERRDFLEERMEDLKNASSPRHKEEIQKDIDEIKKLIEHVTKKRG